MRRLIAGFLFMAITLVSSGVAYALPSGVPETSKEQIVKKYLEGQSLDLVEGVWAWNINEYKMEVAIIKNKTDNFKEFEYIGVMTKGGWGRGVGEVKLALRGGGGRGVYPGIYIIQKGLVGQDKYITRFVMTDENMIEVVVPAGIYNLPIRVFMIRTDTVRSSNAKPKPAGSGTGFFITGSFVVTNHHVIEGAKEVEVTFRDEIKLPATVVAKDPSNDLALLKVAGLEDAVTPLLLGAVKDAKEGAPVFTVGFPMPTVMGVRAKLSEGIINSLTGWHDDARMFQISVPIQPGNSGGPLLNNKGQVIGVTTEVANSAYFLERTGVVPQNVNFAMKINYITNLLSILPEEVKLPPAQSDATLDAEKIMEMAKKAVVFIQTKK